MKKILLVIAALVPGMVHAQTDTTRTIATSPAPLTLSGYVDAYYGYDFNKPENHERAGFLYNHNRHHEFNVNLAFLKASWSADRVRGNVSLMAGTYAQYNLAAEQALLRNVFEANAGVKLGRGLWLDAGIFPSHIGLESDVSKDNITLSRSLGAENTPYYECGAKLTYEAGSKWTLTGLVLNGWQNIREQEGNGNKAVGTQLQFKPSSKVLFNSSTFIGNEKPDSTRQMRYFHDLYVTIQLRENLKMATIFDIGIEEKAGASGFHTWYNPSLLLHYKPVPQWGLGARAEYYSDRNGIIISTGTPRGFKTFGYSLNLDYAPLPNVLWRLEGRVLDSRDAIFVRQKKAVDESASLLSAIAISF
ncbi:MAG: porin [Adhaeribacter sp.]